MFKSSSVFVNTFQKQYQNYSTKLNKGLSMAWYILHIYECCSRKCNAALQADTFVYLSLYIYRDR